MPASTRRDEIPLSPPFTAESGHAWVAEPPDLSPGEGDSGDAPDRSSWRLLEDGRPLGPAHSLHAQIREDGAGAFSHWGDKLYFSTSDNSDPNTNGRRYSLAPKPGPGLLARLRRALRTLPGSPTRQRLKGPFLHRDGHAWIALGLADFGVGDHPDAPNTSPLMVYENGTVLGPPHSAHCDVAAHGGGRFSHWVRQLVFSTSDNSDPNTNGRRYEVALDRDAFFAAHARRALSIVTGWLQALPGGLQALHGRTVMEIGPGPDMGTLVLLVALGARRVIALDPYRPSWRPDWHPYLMTALGQEAMRLGLPVDRAVFKRAARGGAEAVNIAYTGRGIENLPPEWCDTADVMLSHAVLEHFGQPQAAATMMAAAARPGAVAVHDVDFRDHRNFDRPLEFLLLDDAAWEQANDGVQFRHGNRVRLPEWSALLAEAGWQVLSQTVTDPVDPAYLADLAPRLRACGTRFAGLPDDQLTCASARLVLRKP